MRQQALDRMDTILQDGLSAAGNDHKQRLAVNALIRESAKAGEPLLEWLAKRLSQPAVNTPTAATRDVKAFVCDDCGRTFKTHHALCGHRRIH